MSSVYYDTVTRMEKAGVDSEYVQGWQCGYLLNPRREEQRLTSDLAVPRRHPTGTPFRSADRPTRPMRSSQS